MLYAPSDAPRNEMSAIFHDATWNFAQRKLLIREVNKEGRMSVATINNKRNKLRYILSKSM